MDKNSELWGLAEAEIIESRREHGRNLITPPAEMPWWRLYAEKFRDPIIVILLVATLISLVAGFMHGNFTESAGIIAAIIISTGVGFWQEWDAKRKFEAMKSDRDFEPVKVRRDGGIMEIPKDRIVVGDVVILASGDEIPADIRLVKAVDMRVAEAAMTGESLAVAKYPMDGPYSGSGFAPDMLLRGTTIEQGMGEGVVVAVGDSTEIGRTTRQASVHVEMMTPLEEKLHALARRINVAAFIVAGAMFVILNWLHWRDNAFTLSWETLLTELQILMGAVVVIIVAVPEGLPLSVTLALASSMKTMARENNLVKKMHACETIGAVNIIFTDKTGTLTQNMMTVVNVDIAEGGGEFLRVVGATNATAEWSAERVLGNPTEGAILKWLGRTATETLRDRYAVVDVIPFSSAYKYMVSHLLDRQTGDHATVIKGAPEVVGRIIGRTDFLAKVAEQQERGRRAIAAAVLATHDIASTREMIDRGEVVAGSQYLGTWFIEDPVRGDVPDAVARCYGAGIDVVMMTGDNIKTGSEIARQAGFGNIWAIEAKDFFISAATLQQNRNYPNVISRCTPSDKLEILKWAQQRGYVCAMTGDGVNDSPSLNHADVGIAMGSGTSVAKEAADIVLLDDAFPSIVTGIKWGRSLYKNIKNFLYLQLSINVSACLIALFGPLVGVGMPFTVTQFLWINLVMDALAAIALVSEPAEERVLKERPRDRKAFIIDRLLVRSIFGFGGFIWILCTALLWGMANAGTVAAWGCEPLARLLAEIDMTVFFAGYMTLNWWNMFNARVIGKNKSVFAGLGSNMKFTITMALIAVTTYGVVNFGGEVFQTHPLPWQTWGWIYIATCPVVIIRELYHQLIGKRHSKV